jgi:hypothetical protein
MLVKSDNTLDKILEFYKDITDKTLEELKIQAHSNSEQWKFEKVLKEYDDESKKVGEIISRLSYVIRDT